MKVVTQIDWQLAGRMTVAHMHAGVQRESFYAAGETFWTRGPYPGCSPPRNGAPPAGRNTEIRFNGGFQWIAMQMNWNGECRVFGRSTVNLFLQFNFFYNKKAKLMNIVSSREPVNSETAILFPSAGHSSSTHRITARIMWLFL